MYHAGLPPGATWAMIALCGCGAAVAAVGLLAPRPTAGRLGRYGDRGSELFHAVMLTAMSVMWSDTGQTLSVAQWRLLFGALAIAALLWLVASATRGRPGERADRVGAAVYHCVAALAMVYATTGSDPSPAGHIHHSVGAHTADLPYPVLGWSLTVLFLLDSVVVIAAVIRPPGDTEPTRRDIVATVLPHLVMDITMTAMLVAALTAPSPVGFAAVYGSAPALTAGL